MTDDPTPIEVTARAALVLAVAAMGVSATLGGIGLVALRKLAEHAAEWVDR